MRRLTILLSALVRHPLRFLRHATLTVAAVVLPAVSPAVVHAQPSAAADPASGAARAVMAAADQGRTIGKEGAPIWVVIFSDFQCPYCKRWHDDVDAALRRDYVQTGKVRLAFLNFPLNSHPHAVPMAEAAMCAASLGKFWPFHDAAFAAQQGWTGAADVSATIDSLARSAGITEPAFRTCRTQRQTRLLVEEDARRGRAAGVGGTPAFFIGSRAASGAIPATEFFAILEAELAKAKGGARD